MFEFQPLLVIINSRVYHGDNNTAISPFIFIYRSEDFLVPSYTAGYININWSNNLSIQWYADKNEMYQKNKNGHVYDYIMIS